MKWCYRIKTSQIVDKLYIDTISYVEWSPEQLYDTKDISAEIDTSVI